MVVRAEKDKKVVKDQDIEHGLVIGYQYAGPFPGYFPPAFYPYLPEGIEPDVPGSPETGPEMEDDQPPVKPASQEPDKGCNGKKDNGGDKEKGPEQRGVEDQPCLSHDSLDCGNSPFTKISTHPGFTSFRSEIISRRTAGSCRCPVSAPARYSRQRASRTAGSVSCPG